MIYLINPEFFDLSAIFLRKVRPGILSIGFLTLDLRQDEDRFPVSKIRLGSMF